MRKDEFNELKIVNEDENLNFEFGETQESESTSYKDNSDRLRDEINDNKIFNETKPLNKNKKKQRKDKKSEKDGSSSNGSSLATSITTIVGASLISVTTLSTLIGINLFFNAKCKMNRIEPTSNSIVYELDLADINKDECIIKLENDTYNESHELIEGSNTGEFIDLTPSTEYHVAVIDVTYNSYILYEDNIFTKDEDVPPLESCIITFDANGGDGEQKEDIGYVGQEYILPECTFTAPNGYAFDCWQLSGTEDKYNPGEGYLVESQDTITFIALWGEAATLEFYPRIGAQGNVTSIKYVIGKEYTIPNGEEFFTAPENKEFDYWFDDMYSEQRHAGDVITIEDTYYSFTGHWKYLDGLTFTVTFETNGGSEVESQVVQAGTNATKPDDPMKDDCIFEGWYSNSELTNSYNFIAPVTEDITLYAKWGILRRVTFVTGDDATQIDQQYVISGDLATKPDDPTRENYEFAGWYTSDTYEVEFDFDTMTIEADTSIYAKWNLATVDPSLQFHFDSISNSSTQPELNYSYKYTASSNPYDTFEIVMTSYSGESKQASLNILPTDEVAEESISLSEEIINFLFETQGMASSYQIIASNSATSEESVLDEGTFEYSHALKGNVEFIEIGDVDLEVNNASFPIYELLGRYYLPVYFETCDYKHLGFGHDFTVNYELSNSITRSKSFTYNGGMTYVEIDSQDAPDPGEPIPINQLWFTYLNENEEQILIDPGNGDGYATNVQFVLANSGSVAGFEINESSLLQGEPKVKLIASQASDGSTYADLGVSSATLTFKFYPEAGGSNPISVSANINLNNNSNLGSYIDFTLVDCEYSTFLEYLRRYVTAVTLSYIGGSYDSYMYYSFPVM